MTNVCYWISQENAERAVTSIGGRKKNEKSKINCIL
jgi:hypothetical protein